MTTTVRNIIPATIIGSAQSTQYTAVSIRAVIDKFTAYNGHNAPVQISVNLVQSGGAAAASNLIVRKTLQVGETYTFPELTGHVMEPGGFISTAASVAGVLTIRASGREIS